MWNLQNSVDLKSVGVKKVEEIIYGKDNDSIDPKKTSSFFYKENRENGKSKILTRDKIN